MMFSSAELSLPFKTLEEMVVASAEGIRPTERLTVSQAAAKYRQLNNPGSYVGKWPNEKTPYLVEPMDMLTSMDYTGMVFVGPARTGKSDMFFNWLTHTAICDPADMMFVAMTQNVARDWSSKDLSRMLRASKDVGARLLPGRNNKNIHDIKFRGNMSLLVKWPTITELSGKTIPRGWFADYDRMPDDIDGEGAAFDLGRKRAQTYRRYGMWVAESSPGREVMDAKARLATPHHAPPCKGVLGLYNRGDRRRWYWRCLDCRSAFEPTFECLSYPDSRDLVEASEMVTMKCPVCDFDMLSEQKQELNAGGKWLKDGEQWLQDGRVVGNGPRTDIASFWMFGPSAAFQTWTELVYKYLTAKREFDNTGDPGPLKTTINTDQGRPFTPPALTESRSPEWLEQRKCDWGGTAEHPVVPEGVRFLIATVDVQAGSRSAFIVQVHGIHTNYDISFVDMFKIRVSDRDSEEGFNGKAIIDPAGYPEDWHLLVPNVITKTYPLNDDSGRRMAIRLVGCDMGGKEGVAPNAYNFWRYLRDNPSKKLIPGLDKRFQLVRGSPTKTAARVTLSYPDANKKDRHSGARGDVPVLHMNSNMLKDQIDAMLNRTEGSGGLVQFPSWAPGWLYSQLTGEIRTDAGWKNTKQRQNEAWDLFYYCIGILASPLIGYENIRWDKPPAWAEEWDRNELVFQQDEPIPFERKRKPAYDLAEIAQSLA